MSQNSFRTFNAIPDVDVSNVCACTFAFNAYQMHKIMYMLCVENKMLVNKLILECTDYADSC